MMHLTFLGVAPKTAPAVIAVAAGKDLLKFSGVGNSPAFFGEGA